MPDTDVSASSCIRLDITESVASITLARETRMNAFDEAMHADLRSAFAKVAADRSVRAVVLTGSGRAFSAGQDIGERATAFGRRDQPDLYRSLEENYNPLVRSIADLPIPVIAAVNGIAFGAGAALAIACDVVVAASSARFQFGFVNVGLGPDSGASWFLPRLVGQARALDLALTGRSVLAEEALAIGLVSRVVADHELIETSTDIAQSLTSRSSAALSAIKQQMRSNPLGTLSSALDAERDAQAVLGGTDDYREAVLRFVNARK